MARNPKTKARIEEIPIVLPDPIVLDETGESPTVEVRVWAHGKLLHRELCESVEVANDIVDAWGEFDEVECEIEDLAVRHSAEETIEPPVDLEDADADREHGARRSYENE